MQDKPALFSTFMLWMLATLYHDLPEVGDVDKPKLVFFFDEAHLIFDDASKALLDQIEQVVRLIRSKGVGVFFITQSPKDVPATVLGQLGHRVQHALRAFTPDDEKALKAAARTFPKTKFYDIEETLTTLGIGEALVTVLSPSGVPTPPFATRLIPPASRMGPLTDDEMQQRLASSAQVRKYATAVDRESAREMLSERAAAGARAAQGEQDGARRRPRRRAARGGKAPPTAFEQILKSPVTRTVAGVVTRGLMGALLGSLGVSAARRRRRVERASEAAPSARRALGAAPRATSSVRLAARDELPAPAATHPRVLDVLGLDLGRLAHPARLPEEAAGRGDGGIAVRLHRQVVDRRGVRLDHPAADLRHQVLPRRRQRGMSGARHRELRCRQLARARRCRRRRARCATSSPPP